MKAVGRAAFGDVLCRLWRELVGWLGHRVQCPQDREDIAGECVVRAWRTFHDREAPWPLLWTWATRVARSIILQRLRRARVLLVELSGEEIERMVAVSSSESMESALGRLQPLLPSDGDRLTLRMLASGAAVEDVASARGVTQRSVRSSLARIRQLISLAGK